MFTGSLLTFKVTPNMGPGRYLPPDPSQPAPQPPPPPTSQIQEPRPRGPMCGDGCEELFRLSAVKGLLVDQRPRPSDEVIEKAKQAFETHAASCASDGCAEYRKHRAEIKELYRVRGWRHPREDDV